MLKEKILSYPELLEFIKEEGNYNTDKEVYSDMGISQKTFYNLKDSKKQEGKSLGKSTKHKINNFMRKKFNLSLNDLADNKIQIVEKQIVNVSSGDYTFSAGNGKGIFEKKINYLLDKVIALEEENKRLKEKLDGSE